MQVQTELQPMFSYSLFPIFLVIILFIVTILLNKTLKRKELRKNIVIPKEKDLIQIKNNYLQKIQELITKVNNKEISNREAYQTLSNIIRNFIFESTNIKVQNYTLYEIKLINMPVLYELVSEYYDPEFACISRGNIINSINKTRTVIEKWN